MLTELKKILNNMQEIDGWKIMVRDIEASEFFYIKENLDMNRAKSVKKINVTVYKDFSEGDEKYRGSSTVNIYPTMGKQNIKEALKEAITGAGYVRNEYYPLVQPVEKETRELESVFSEKSHSEWLPKITEAVFAADSYERGWINSTELFLNTIKTHILNSRGVDVEYNKNTCQLVFITNWQEEDGEEVELYKKLDFATFNGDELTEEVKKMLAVSRERAKAEPTPGLKDVPVILSGDPVKEFFKYYYQQANAKQVYEKVSTASINNSIQGKEVIGDNLTLKLDPCLSGSTESAPYDKDGFPLQEVKIIDQGVLKKFWGDNRHSYYLGIEPTGQISNYIVTGGNRSVNTLKEDTYLELLAFSNFRMNVMTGDFGGEIRLGRYCDGKQVIPVTGGAISGNIKEVQEEMYLSKENQSLNNFSGPESVKLHNVSISGD